MYAGRRLLAVLLLHMSKTTRDELACSRTQRVLLLRWPCLRIDMCQCPFSSRGRHRHVGHGLEMAFSGASAAVLQDARRSAGDWRRGLLYKPP